MSEPQQQESAGKDVDEAMFLLGLEGAVMMLSILWDASEALGMPPAVTNGLMWIRDDAVTVLADAAAWTKPKEN